MELSSKMEEDLIINLPSKSLRVIGVDWCDLPPPLEPDEEASSWLRRIDHCVSSWEIDKVVSKAISDPSKQGTRFTRVFMIHGSNIDISIMKKPKRTSPMRWIYQKNSRYKHAINSTSRIQVTFRKHNQLRQCYGTTFNVLPSISITAGHCILGVEEGQNLKEVRGCSLNPNVAQHFSKSSSSSFGMVALTKGTCWGEDVSCKGLQNSGSDVAFLRRAHAVGKDPSFLLPCSPRYHAVGKEILVCSYPDTYNFLITARAELNCREDTPLWQAYKPAMGLEIAQAVRGMAEKLGTSEGDIFGNEAMLAEACIKVKDELLRDLMTTFEHFPSGVMLASIGYLILDDNNECCIGTTASLLMGSSGAAICPLSLLHYFVGVHSGGSKGFDLNIATSTDSPDFYVDYIQRVLPKLPPPSSKIWNNVDLNPFFDWLLRIKDSVSPESPWLKATFDATKKTKISKKRAESGR